MCGRLLAAESIKWPAVDRDAQTLARLHGGHNLLTALDSVRRKEPS